MRVLVLVCLFFLGFVESKVMKLSCKQIRQLLDGHNKRRLSLAKGEVEGQPAAAEMKYMVWDKELARKASAWAGNEFYGHNPNKTIPSKRFETGENIYWLGTTNGEKVINLDDALTAWWDEYKDFTYKPLEAQDFAGSKPIGHYTQMAWSTSIFLGCGVSKYWKDNWLNYFVVCNYGPAGNYLGQTPYKEGTASDVLTCGTNDCSKPYGKRCSG